MKQFYLSFLFLFVFNLGMSNELRLPPSATITGTTTVCQNATSPLITFTGSGGTAPYTFTYTINGGASQTIQTNGSNNTVTLSVPTGTAGTYTYSLVNVTDSSPPPNPITVSGNAIVTITSPPTVDFTFTNNNSCSGTSIQFNSNVSGSGPNSYSWDFGDGTPSSNLQNPSHTFTSLGCGTMNFNVILTVISNGCTVTKQHTISVKQKPDIDFTDVNFPFDPFSNCSNASSNPVYSITVGNISASQSCISSYSINWGDGNTQNNITFPISHTYSNIGAYSMVITANGANGCSNTKTYIIKNVSNPLGGINSPGSTQNLCAPTSNLQFSISNWGSNSLDTTYTVNYGDGTPILVLTQTQMVASSYYNAGNPSSSINYPIPHIYTTSSCPASSFQVTLDVTNACGTTPFTLGNISILTKPTANFTAPSIGCVNTNIQFINTTISGYGQNCAQSAIYTWNFGDGSPIVTTPLSPPQNINHIYTTPGIYTVTLTAQNFCGTTSKTDQICIEPPITPTFSLNTNAGCIPLNVTTNNTTNLTNQCSTPTYNWQVTYAAGNCGTTSGYSFTGGSTASSANPSFSFTEAGTYTISLTTTNSCGSNTTSQTVIVKKPPTVSLAPISNACGSASITPSASVTNCAPSGGTLTYAWNFPGGTPSSSNSLNPGVINYPSGGPYTVTFTATNECGISNTATQNFSVNTAPVITNTVLNQTICSGSSTTLVNLTANPGGTTFNWTATATAGITGFTPTGNTNTIPVQTITTTNTNPGTVTYVITPSFGGCDGTPINYVVNVNPAPVISTQPQSSTVCLGGTPTALSVALNTSSVTPSYQWYSNTSNTTVGGTAISGATNATYNPPASATGTVYYYCIISLSSGGCSSLTSTIANVTVNPLPTIVTQPLASQTICTGGIVAPLTASYSGGLGTATYQWYSNSNNTTSGGTPVGTNSPNYTPPAFSSAGSYYYYVIISLSGNGCGTVISNTAEVIVVPDPTLTSQPQATQTVCQNSPATTLTLSATGGTGTYSYQWYSNPNNTTPAGTAIASATNASYTPPTNIVGTFYYYCVVSQSGIGCSVTGNIVTVIVNASPTIQNQPVSSTVCLGGTPTVLSTSYTNGVGSPTYQWYSNLTNSNTGGNILTGETNSTYTPPASAVGIIYYYCVITFPALTGSCAIVTSNPASITVNPGATITQEPMPNQSLCVGATVTTPLTVSFSGGTGTASYQWYSNTTNTNTGGTPVGTNSVNYTPPVFTVAGTYYYYVVISQNGSGCGGVTSQIAQIDVVNDPVVTGQPLASQTQCQNSTATSLSVSVSGGLGSFNYQWYSNTSPSNIGGSIISGATNSTYIPPTSNVGTQYYYCVITQSGVGCNVTSAVATVTVVTAPIISTQPQSSSVCENGIATSLLVAYSNGTGTASYQWYDNNGAISGGTYATYTPPTDTIGTIDYYCIVTFSSGGCTSITSDTASVTINPQPTIDIQPQSLQSICEGGSISALTVSYTGGVGTVSYQWYSNTNNSTSGGTPVGTNSSSYTPPAFNNPGTYYYYVTINSNGNGCGNLTSNIAEVDVVNDPVVTSQPIATQTLCQNSVPTNLSVSASGGIGSTYNYQWYSSTTNNTSSGNPIAGETNNSYTPPTNIAGTTYYYCIITQALGCDATSAVAELIVNVAPAIATQPQSSIVCVNQAATLLSFTYNNGVGNPNYQWYSNISNLNTGGTPIAGATNATFAPSTALSGTFYYYCEITFPNLSGGCSTITTDTATIVINDNPIISNTNTTICSANIFSVTPVNGGGNLVPLGTTYTWTLPTINPPGAITGASLQTNPQTSISQNLINTTTSPATVTYTVTPQSGNCTGATFNIVVTVNPAINPNIVVTNNSCYGVDIASITTSITGGIPPYSISWTGPNGFTSSANSITNLEPGNYSITIDDTGNCPFTSSYTITEPDDIAIITNIESDITCYGYDNGSIDITITGGSGNYFYTWTKDNSFFASTQDISNLAPGTYIVSVTDENNCGPKTATFTITEPPLLVVSLVSQTNIQCFGAATGAITTNVVGGTSLNGYIFSWTGPNGFTSNSQNLSALFAGVYNLSVTDDNGCSQNLSVTLTQSPDIIISYTTTPITCYGANNGSLTVTLSGGVVPYQFQWNNLSTSLSQNNLSAGNYIITVTDNLGCVKVQSITIPEAPIFTVNPIVSNVTCYGANNGSIDLNLTGGIAPVALTWSDGSTAGLIRNNLPPGTYTATISDGTPCYIVRTFTIIQPQPLVLSANLTNPINCTNASSGAIDLIVSGGTPPFTYSWSNGSATEDLSNLVSGTYQVTVTDANGCTATGQYNLVRPNPLQIVVNTQTTFDCAAHEVTQNFIAQASGGVPPYQYQWSSGNISGSNNEIMQSDTNGTVILTVTDAIGCNTTYTVTVDNPEIGYSSFDTNSYGYTTYGIYSIGDPIQLTSNITGDYESVSWDFGDGTFSTELNPIHTYNIPRDYIITQTVTYPFGCVYIQTITLTVEKGYLLVVPTAFTPNNDTMNDSYRPVTKRLKSVQLDIYDSWGSLIFTEKGDVLVGWDGKIKGFNAENGNYYCKVSAETFYGTIINESETFVLIK